MTVFDFRIDILRFTDEQVLGLRDFLAAKLGARNIHFHGYVLYVHFTGAMAAVAIFSAYNQKRGPYLDLLNALDEFGNQQRQMNPDFPVINWRLYVEPNTSDS